MVQVKQIGVSYLVGKESSHTHTHCLSWVAYLNFLWSGKIICAKLKSQLSFISLFSFEMLSDCVINWLYMRILTLTWENLIYVNFSSVFLVFQCGVSGRSLLASGRVEFSQSDVSFLESWRGWSLVLCPDACWHHREDGYFISSGHAWPICSFLRQRVSGRHQNTVWTGTPQKL